MRRVVRLVRALGAGASVVWGLAKSLRRGGDTAPASDPAPGWPPPQPDRPEPPPTRVDPAVVPELAPKQASVPLDTDAIPEPDRLSVPLAEAAGVPAEPLVLKGVSVEDPAALLAFANDATDDQLKEAGIKGKALATLVDARPYASADALGDTPGVGRRTLQALCAAL